MDVLKQENDDKSIKQTVTMAYSVVEDMDADDEYIVVFNTTMTNDKLTSIYSSVTKIDQYLSYRAAESFDQWRTITCTTDVNVTDFPDDVKHEYTVTNFKSRIDGGSIASLDD